jgi:hypothetical protein
MMPASSRPTTGVAVLALLAVVDISYLALAWFGALGSADAPPTGVLILFAAVGIVTLATVQPAQRGNRTAAWIMVGSRVVSVLLIDLPGRFLNHGERCGCRCARRRRPEETRCSMHLDIGARPAASSRSGGCVA